MVETRNVPFSTHFEHLIARLKIQQKRGLSPFDKNSISIRGTNATAGEKRKRWNKGLEEKENVTTCVEEEKEWNYTRGFTMSPGTSVSSLFTSILPLLSTAQCTPACIHADRVYAAQLTTISASFRNASTRLCIRRHYRISCAYPLPLPSKSSF